MIEHTQQTGLAIHSNVRVVTSVRLKRDVGAKNGGESPLRPNSRAQWKRSAIIPAAITRLPISLSTRHDISRRHRYTFVPGSTITMLAAATSSHEVKIR